MRGSYLSRMASLAGPGETARNIQCPEGQLDQVSGSGSAEGIGGQKGESGGHAADSSHRIQVFEVGRVFHGGGCAVRKLTSVSIELQIIITEIFNNASRSKKADPDSAHFRGFY